MTQKTALGRRLTRDCFLCLGGVFLLIALANLVGNWPGTIKYSDWLQPDLREIIWLSCWTAAWGAIFLVAAYGLFSRKRWAAPFVVVVSLCALISMASSVTPIDRSDPDFWTVLLFYSTPMLLTLGWGITATVGEFAAAKKRQRDTQIV